MIAVARIHDPSPSSSLPRVALLLAKVQIWVILVCMKLLTTTAVLGLAASICHAQLNRVYVQVFDYDFSINGLGDPIVDAVVPPNTEVFWAVVEGYHSTISCAGQAEEWASPMMFENEGFSHIFTIPGVYTYYCDPHGSDNGDGTASGMAGTITVTPAPGAGGVLAAGALVFARRGSRRR